MTRKFVPLLLSAFTLVPSQAEGVRYVAARDLVVSYRMANQAPIENTRLFISRDRGRSWKPLEATAPAPGQVAFEVPADGRYDFYIVLENQAGASAPLPVAGTTPHGAVLVDTTPPLIQLHAAEIIARENDVLRLKLRLSLIEEYLHDAGVHLFFRAAGATLWQDAGAIRRAGRHATIGLPLSSDAPLELRLVTADLAGNRSVSETVRLDPRPAPAAPQDASTANATLVEQPRPVSVAKNVADADQTTAPPPAPPLSKIASQLQKRADAFLAEGRYGLAEARLRDALAQMPDHPDLLLDLGQVLYRQERFDDAGTNFANVLNQQPENLDATEWMAIVAQTQRRYPEAREHLQRLLDHQPEAGIFWLRYGDVEHRLGRVADAIKAWERALGAEQADAETRAKAERRLRQIAPLAEVQLSAR